MFFRITGNLLVAFGLLGFAYLALGSSAAFERPSDRSGDSPGLSSAEDSPGLPADSIRLPPPDSSAPPTDSLEPPPATVDAQPEGPGREIVAAPVESSPAEPSQAPSESITHVRVPRLQIDSEVVAAPFVQVADFGTWQVPAFKVGHAEYTARAGQVGNAVLFGHVTSRSLGNVFQTLERARHGDVVQISSGVEEFTYHVVEVRRVPRTDISVVQPTDTASASLITCIGAWLPSLNDYAERLVVRAELVG